MNALRIAVSHRIGHKRGRSGDAESGGVSRAQTGDELCPNKCLFRGGSVWLNLPNKIAVFSELFLFAAGSAKVLLDDRLRFSIAHKNVFGDKISFCYLFIPHCGI